MKKTIYLLLFIGFSTSGIAQDSLVNKNNLFIELYGSAGIYSLNYERVYLISPALNLTSRVGFAYLGLSSPWNLNIISCPVSFSALLGKHDNRIELGISCAYYTQNVAETDKNDRNNLLNGLIIGYRLQPKNKHVIIRITYTPLLKKSLNSNDHSFYQGGGFSFGYSF
jgi:hypothetical protein